MFVKIHDYWLCTIINIIDVDDGERSNIVDKTYNWDTWFNFTRKKSIFIYIDCLIVIYIYRIIKAQPGKYRLVCIHILV